MIHFDLEDAAYALTAQLQPLRVAQIPASARWTPADTIPGTPGDDTLVGTEGTDRIDGGDGNDLLQGLGGNDKLFGGSGDDLLQGGEGDDTLQGTPTTHVDALGDALSDGGSIPPASIIEIGDLA